MRILSIGVAAASAALALASALGAQANPYASLPTTSTIKDITSPADFDAALLRAGRSAPLLLVHVHGRCSACQALAPAFIAAAARASGAERADLVMREVEWGRVDGRAEGGGVIMERYGVEGNGPAERRDAASGPTHDHAAESTSNQGAGSSASSSSGSKSIKGYPILVFSSPSAEPLVLNLDGVQDDDDDVQARADAIFSFARQQIRLKSPAQSSADVLEAAVKERVLALNADTFHSVVMDPSKDVLVKFYAPWCSHCKKLAPRYARVAALFAEHPTCLVTTLNSDAPAERAIAKEHQIRGFPTLKFYPSSSSSSAARTNASKAEPEVYRGPRSPEAMVKFLNERCGTDVVLPTLWEEWAQRLAPYRAKVDALLGRAKEVKEKVVSGATSTSHGRGQEL